MTPVQRELLLSSLAQKQDVCAPITVQIGAVTGNQVKSNCIRVLEAPNSVLEHIFEWVKHEQAHDEPYVQAFLQDGAIVVL